MSRLLIVISFLYLSVSTYAQGSNFQKTKPDTSSATAADILFSLETPDTSSNIRTPPIFTGSIELGFLYKTGNTNSGDVKTGLDFRFEKSAWLSLLNIDLLLKKSDVVYDNGDTHFETTDNKWTVSSQTNYNLDNEEQNYIYGNIWYEENEFSSFDNQSSISTGWGRHWYRTNQASLWGDIGPGYKRDLYKETDTDAQRTADTFIVQVQALYIRKIGDHIEFKEYLSAKQALDTDENSIYKSETIITTKLISTLQLKFTITLGYNTNVDEEQKNFDTQTAATLVYSF
jgi:putative salt-induced outer membrane protein YdiY